MKKNVLFQRECLLLLTSKTILSTALHLFCIGLISIFAGTTLFAQTWTPQNTGFGNFVRVAPFKTSVVDENTLWASPSTPTASFFGDTSPLVAHTSDGGLTWKVDELPTAMPDDFTIITIDAISSDSAWLVALENVSAQPNWTVLVLATFDGGDTWIAQDVELSDNAIYPSQMHFFDAQTGILFASSTDGYFQAFRTTDAGMNWERLPAENVPPLATSDEFDVDHTYFAHGDDFWLGTSAGRFLHSGDRGLTWEAINTPASGIIMKVSFSDELHGVAQYANGFDWNSNRLIHTADGGQTWSIVNHSGLKSKIFDIKAIPEMAGQFLCTSYNNLNDIELFISEDNGVNWTPIEGISSPGIISLWDAETGWISEISPTTSDVDVYRQESMTGLFEAGEDIWEMDLFPNPAIDWLNFNLPENFSANFQVELYSMQGKLLEQKYLKKGQKFLVKHLQKGFYIMKIRNEGEIYFGRFLKK